MSEFVVIPKNDWSSSMISLLFELFYIELDDMLKLVTLYSFYTVFLIYAS